MSWKKHLTAIPQGVKLQAAMDRIQKSMTDTVTLGAGAKFSSYLPEVYAGQPNRRERYLQYNTMDRDPEVNAALDVIADFATLTEEENDIPFKIRYIGEPTESESEIIREMLINWSNLNKFKQRIWGLFRSTIIYGDQFFLRDPETFELYWINHEKVESITVNEAQGKRPIYYNVHDIDLNINTLVATLPTKSVQYGMSGWAGQGVPGTAKSPGPVSPPSTPMTGGSYGLGHTTTPIGAEHIVHFSISTGMDSNWPFGNSVLESVFKPYKQKELLEDSVIIYRVQRAPERRVFYIDVGNAPTHKAMEFVNRIKNEIHQRRIPSQTGGGTNLMDASYNPLCLSLDTTVPLLDGRTLTIKELIDEYNLGKENWTYSCNPITGKIVPGNITWAGITRKNTQVIKLHLDDGSTVVVTPDHKIPVLGKGFVEAQNLTENDSLISFKSREKSLVSSNSDRTYTQVYDHELNEWVYTHRMVGNFFKHINKHQEFTYLEENIGAHKSVIHHKDFNRYNNDPRNLQWMNHQDHIKYHQNMNMWKHITDEEANTIKNKISETNKKNWGVNKLKWINNIKNAQAKAVWLRCNNDESKKRYKENMGKSRKIFLKNNPSFIEKVLLPNLSTWQENMPNQTKIYTFEQLQALYDLANKHNFKLKYMIKDIENHNTMLEEIKKVNTPDPKKQFKIQINKITQQVIYNTIRHFGYKNWMDFKRKKENFNHRVVKIEWLDRKQDTGTITIDGSERWHSYHTFPVNNCIYVKNSIIEDYFFPQTCISLKTLIPLLDGRELTLEEIIDEYNKGKENYVYGLSNTTFELEPAEIVWAGVTRKNTEVVRVKLDNGEEITVTPDHRFVLRDGSEKEAKDLKQGESLMPLDLILGYSGPKQQNKKYTNNIINIVNIEYLSEKIDTGDITIKSKSNSHWFGVSAGIYIHNSEGRGSKVETLPGGDSLGEIADLRYFNLKLLRGLRVPPSYLPFGSDESGAQTYSDGRVGTAYMQEFRFAKYVKRLQNLLNVMFDSEFKMFLNFKGMQIDPSMFEIELHEPQNFSKFRQLEIDAAQINTFQPLADVPYLSKRFVLERFLRLTPDEINKNERLWREENPNKSKPSEVEIGSTGDVDVGLGDVGIRPDQEGMEGMGDIDTEEPGEVTGEESPITGGEFAEEE